jgi:hypothetical protein
LEEREDEAFGGVAVIGCRDCSYESFVVGSAVDTFEFIREVQDRRKNPDERQ